MKFQMTSVRKFIVIFVSVILGNQDGQSMWERRNIRIMLVEWNKLRRKNVGNVDVGGCLNYIGEKILHVIFA